MGTKENPGTFDCYNDAQPNEPMFVLLGRDPVAPILVGMWVELRKAIGDEHLDKLREAEACANSMVNYLFHPDRPMKDGFTRKQLLGSAIVALRNDFVAMVTRALPDVEETRENFGEAGKYQKELRAVIANNTGIEKRALSAAVSLLNKSHTYESARMQLVKDVHKDVVIVYLHVLDAEYKRRQDAQRNKQAKADR